MSIFSLGRKPRRFNHVPIFYDERADRLAEIERKAQQTDGQGASDQLCPDDLRGAFLLGTTHLRRSKERKGQWTGNIGILIVLILVCALVWFYLI